MEIDKDIQKLIDTFVDGIEIKKEELDSFKSSVDALLLNSQNRSDEVIKILDKRFDNNEITEGEYLKDYKEAKKQVVLDLKDELDKITSNLTS
jgi:hypothetical protein